MYLYINWAIVKHMVCIRLPIIDNHKVSLTLRKIKIYVGTGD
jgi:hypothetical protein